MSGDERERQERATARGERLRARLLELLRLNGPLGAIDLLAALEPDVSLSEIAFQLERLAEDGRAIGEPGGSYRIA